MGANKSPLEKNTLYILLSLVGTFFVSIWASIVLFFRTLVGKKADPIRENPFLDAMNFGLHIGPKSFWKAPSGLKIGRSLSTFIHYIFFKDDVFKEKK